MKNKNNHSRHSKIEPKFIPELKKAMQDMNLVRISGLLSNQLAKHDPASGQYMSANSTQESVKAAKCLILFKVRDQQTMRAKDTSSLAAQVKLHAKHHNIECHLPKKEHQLFREMEKNIKTANKPSIIKKPWRDAVKTKQKPKPSALTSALKRIFKKTNTAEELRPTIQPPKNDP